MKGEPMTHVYYATFECLENGGFDFVDDVFPIEIRVHYTYKPERPARINYTENDHPAEAEEIEIDRVEMDVGTEVTVVTESDIPPRFRIKRKHAAVWIRAFPWLENWAHSIDVDDLRQNAERNTA
jgi:hypothetical protein